MCGLRKVLDVKGDMTGLPQWLVSKMYKCVADPAPSWILSTPNQVSRADLRGASALASMPYLPFTRQYNPISATLPPEVCNRTLNSLTTLLYPLHVHPEVISSLVSLSTLASAIRLAREPPKTMAFDPHAFTEEWQALTHALLTQPQPLRAVQCPLQCASNNANPYSTGAADPASSIASPTENYIANHRLLPTAHIAPATPHGPAGHLDPALRIAALLYLKELLPEWPRNLGGYAVLLTLLRHHMTEIIRRYSSSRRLPEPHRTKTTPGIPPSLIDPLLTGTTDPTPLSTPPPTATTHRPQPPSQATLHLLRPLLIFLSLVGDTVSRIADTNEDRLTADERYPRAVYRDCLREVVGLAREEGIDALGEEDLAFVRLFDLRMVFGREDGGLVGWEERAALRGVVLE
jgi:hypothetical protein